LLKTFNNYFKAVGFWSLLKRWCAKKRA
jgi:hypothetical protein